MAQTKAAKTGSKSGKTTKVTTRAAEGFTAEERSAMKDRVKEMRAAAGKEDDESAVLAKIAEMSAADRSMAERLHKVIKTSAPALSPRLWYGMPAYAKDGSIVCHFQPADKFKTRYPTLGFSDKAKLDEGAMWPVAFALKQLDAAEEARIGALVKRAVS